VLAGNKCECTAAQRAVDKERGDKVRYFKLLSNQFFIKYPKLLNP
jgi:hypothetical protein